MTRPRTFVLSNMLPRWVTDFNAVTTHLARSGHLVTMYAPAPDPAASSGWRSAQAIEAARRCLDADVDLRFLPFRNNRIGVSGVARNMWLTVRLAGRHPGALFMLWTIIPIVLCGPVLRLMQRRTVYMITGLGSVFSDSGPRHRLRPFVERLYGWLFATPRCRIIVHNEANKTFLVRRFGVPPDHVVVTPGCGVDPRAFPFSPELPRNGTPVILVPVRLLAEKGVRDAAQASARLAGAGVDHEMWFTSNVDPTQPTALTQSEIDRLGKDIPTVRFLGHQRDLVGLYQRCDVVCVPTYYQEGLPTALLEAAAVGRPIVTCDNVGGNEFIRDGIDGLLVPPRSPEALANALARLLGDRQLAGRVRDSAHARFLHGYTKRVMLDRTLDAVRALGFAVPDPDGAAAPPPLQHCR
jgi:glycosyltransferase involved in cell wall biosynthesis